MGSLFKASLSKAHSPMKQVSATTGSTQNVHSSSGDFCEEQEPMSRTEVLFRTYWRRAWVVLLWFLACLGLFVWKFVQYSHRSGFEVMGYCLPTAKGAAETLKLNMALVLLPVCRNTITWLRKHRPINSVIPFNDNINFHKVNFSNSPLVSCKLFILLKAYSYYTLINIDKQHWILYE